MADADEADAPPELSVFIKEAVFEKAGKFYLTLSSSLGGEEKRTDVTEEIAEKAKFKERKFSWPLPPEGGDVSAVEITFGATQLLFSKGDAKIGEATLKLADLPRQPAAGGKPVECKCDLTTSDRRGGTVSVGKLKLLVEIEDEAARRRAAAEKAAAEKAAAEKAAAEKAAAEKAAADKAAAEREEAERAQRALEDAARAEAEDKARREAEEAARKAAEEAAAAERARAEAEEKARREAEEAARLEAARLARLEAEERARREIEEAERAMQEELARRRAEAQARLEAEEAARRAAAEERARREAERLARRAEYEQNWKLRPSPWEMRERQIREMEAARTKLSAATAARAAAERDEAARVSRRRHDEYRQAIDSDTAAWAQRRYYAMAEAAEQRVELAGHVLSQLAAIDAPPPPPIRSQTPMMIAANVVPVAAAAAAGDGASVPPLTKADMFDRGREEDSLAADAPRPDADGPLAAAVDDHAEAADAGVEGVEAAAAAASPASAEAGGDVGADMDTEQRELQLAENAADGAGGDGVNEDIDMPNHADGHHDVDHGAGNAKMENLDASVISARDAAPVAVQMIGNDRPAARGADTTLMARTSARPLLRPRSLAPHWYGVAGNTDGFGVNANATFRGPNSPTPGDISEAA